MSDFHLSDNQQIRIANLIERCLDEPVPTDAFKLLLLEIREPLKAALKQVRTSCSSEAQPKDDRDTIRVNQLQQLEDLCDFMAHPHRDRGKLLTLSHGVATNIEDIIMGDGMIPVPDIEPGTAISCFLATLKVNIGSKLRARDDLFRALLCIELQGATFRIPGFEATLHAWSHSHRLRLYCLVRSKIGEVIPGPFGFPLIITDLRCMATGSHESDFVSFVTLAGPDSAPHFPLYELSYDSGIVVARQLARPSH